MTEDEAKTKWCPFVRYVAENERTFPLNNREERLEGPEGKTSRCIASACMAWRWRDETPRDPWLAQAERDGGLAHNRDGFCGLAGVPK